MRLRRPFILLAFAACTAAPPPASTPPPPVPPPVRPFLAATLFGDIRVATRAGAHAVVTATVASPDCLVTGDKGLVFANERGEYDLTIEAGTGPELRTCVVLDAFLGGAESRVEVRDVVFRTRTSAAPPPRTRADIELQPASPLTARAADALVESLTAVLRGEGGDELTLATYVSGGPEALRTAREDHQSLGIAPSLTIDESLVHTAHGALLDYSLRSRLWAADFSRTVAAGDTFTLARLLTADDVQASEEDAARVIAQYKPPFEATSGKFEIIGLDEQRHTLTYRITWFNGEQSYERVIELGYGDGLLWLKQ